MSNLLLVFAAFAFLLWWFLHRRAALLPGEMVWRDTPEARTLVSHRYELAGRPDYVVREKRGLVPVEVKSRACGRGPYDGERAQLLAYCLLVEEEYGEPVAVGVLQYRDRSVRVPFGDAERKQIATLLTEMSTVRDAHRSHTQAARCRNCGFRGRCSEALG